jgi:hypothetical protein
MVQRATEAAAPMRSIATGSMLPRPMRAPISTLALDRSAESTAAFPSRLERSPESTLPIEPVVQRFAAAGISLPLARSPEAFAATAHPALQRITSASTSSVPDPTSAAETETDFIPGDGRISGALPSLQRVPMQEWTLQAAPAPAGSVAESPAAAGATEHGADDQSRIDDLAAKLYDKIRTRLRTELLVDRERAGLLTDLR